MSVDFIIVSVIGVLSLVHHLKHPFGITMFALVVILSGSIVMIEYDFIEDEFPQDSLVKGVLFELKVKISDRVRFRFIILRMEIFKVGMG